MLRIGLMGAGRIGTFHGRTLIDHPDVESLVIADVVAPRAEDLAAALGAWWSSDVDDVFGDVDAIVIATATDAHAPLLRRAADAAVPAFCEKPIALDLATTDEVVARVAKSGIAVQMGFQRRFDAGYRRAQEAVASGDLGTLYLVRLATHDEGPPPESYVATSGGIYKDCHIHDFDIARFVTGQEVVEVYADGSTLVADYFAEHGDVDTSAIVLRFSAGTLGLATAARHDPLGHDVRMELLGSGGSVAVGWNERTPMTLVEPDAAPLSGPAYGTFLDRFEPAYRAEMYEFVDVARGRVPSPCTVEDARRALRIATACGMSRAEHRPVLVEEVA